MADVVTNSTSQMTEADRQAIATYLKDQPGQPVPYSPAPDAAVMQLGAMVYDQQCAACHTGHGTGIDGLAPAFAHAPSIQASDPINLVRAVLLGAASVATDSCRDASVWVEAVRSTDCRRAQLYPGELGQQSRPTGCGQSPSIARQPKRWNSLKRDEFELKPSFMWRGDR